MPLLYIVNKATHFQASRWLQNISVKYTQDTLRVCQINTYLGPPDFITIDTKKNFISKEFKQYTANMGITVKGVLVKAYNLVSIVKHYHRPLQRVYQIVTAEIPGINKDIALQMAFKALNNSAGPNGLIPTLLVFKAYL